MRDKKDLVGLDLISHNFLTHGSAFRDMDCGEVDGAGINHISWIDVMHTFCRGTMDKIKECYAAEIRPDKKKEYEQLLDNLKRLEKGKPVEKTEKEKQKNDFRAVTGQLATLFDQVSIYWGKLLQHQSDRSLGKTYFPNGIATGETTKFTCGEMPGVLLLHVLLLSSTIGTQFFETPPTEADRDKGINDGGYEFRMESKATADYIWAMEDIIMMHELVRSSVMTVAFVQDYLHTYIEKFMERLTKNVKRRKGVNWRFLKFHSLMHLSEMLVEVGNAMGTDSDTGR